VTNLRNPRNLNVRPGKLYSAGDLPLAPNREVPAAARRMVERQIRASIENETKRRNEHAGAMRKLGEDFRKERRALLGADGYTAYRALIKEESHRRAAALLPKGKMELSDRDRRRMRQEQRRRLLAFLSKAGVNLKQLEEQDARMLARVAKLTPPTPRAERVRPIASGRVPKHVLMSRGNPDTDPPPPYNTYGEWTYVYTNSDAFTINGSFWGNNKNVGTLGQIAQLQIWDADNSDYGIETRRSVFGFWYQLPQNAKKLNIWIEAELLHARHYQYMTTEWYGNSYATFRQQNALCSQVVGVGSDDTQGAVRYWAKPPPGTGVPGGIQNLKGTWDSGTFTQANAWYLLQHAWLPQPVPPPNGNWVYIWVGSESEAQMFVDDENGHGFVMYRWKFNNIVFDPVT